MSRQYGICKLWVAGKGAGRQCTRPLFSVLELLSMINPQVAAIADFATNVFHFNQS